MAKAAALHAPLTVTRRRLLNAIFVFNREHGYSPTVRDLQLSLGFANPSSIHEHLRTLRQAGLVTWVERQPRTLVLTPLGQRAIVER